VVIAALKKLVENGTIGRDELTVAYITGAGLKTQEAVADPVIQAHHVAPNVESFEQRLGLAPLAAGRESAVV
jgi:threonine synthase